MITKITINNFKSIKFLELNLSNINLLAGLNSSGKSSAIQALYMADRIASGEKVQDLGDISDLQCRYASDNEIYGIVLQQDCVHKQEILFNAKYNYGNGLGFNLHFIRADRFGPQLSFYCPKGIKPDSVGERGENIIPFFLEHESIIINDIRKHKGAEADTLAANVDAWMREICPSVSFDFNIYLNIDSGYYTIGNRKDNTIHERPTNVGFGVSYTLPIIIQLLAANNCIKQKNIKDIICIENPEAHLHPRGQTKMGELLARTAQAGVQLFVETHSDHIIDGIRIAIKNGILQPERAKVFYFLKTESNITEVESITVDTNGEMSDWPEGFCDQSLKNLSQLARF